MKVYTKDGVVFAQAENLSDVEKLLSLKTKVTTNSTPKKSYNKQYMKTCEDCGRKCKGNIGLANHKCIKKEIKDEFTGPYQPQQKPQNIPVTTT